MNVWENTINQNQAMRPTTAQPPYAPNPTVPAQSNQFIWVNGRAMVDAWPIVANGQMTFIDPDAMKLWIKKADPYGRPFDPEEYDIVRAKPAEEVKPEPAAPSMTSEEIQNLISSEVEKAVSAKMAAIFSVKEPSHD